MVYDDNEELIKRYKNGQFSLKTQIIQNNLLLVRKIINMFSNSDEDLFQSGCLALTEALERYNIDSGVKFSTYAYKFIYFTILNCLNKQRTDIHFSRNLINLFNKYEKCKKEQMEENDILKTLELSEEKYEDFIKLYNGFNNIICVSLEQNRYDYTEEYTFGNLCESENNTEYDAIKFISEIELFKDLKNILTEKEYKIIYMYYKKKMTDQEIGECYNVSQQYIQCTRKKVLKKLKKMK